MIEEKKEDIGMVKKFFQYYLFNAMVYFIIANLLSPITFALGIMCFLYWLIISKVFYEDFLENFFFNFIAFIIGSFIFFEIFYGLEESEVIAIFWSFALCWPFALVFISSYLLYTGSINIPIFLLFFIPSLLPPLISLSWFKDQWKKLEEMSASESTEP